MRRASRAGPKAGGGDDSPELMLFKDIPVVVAAGRREQTQRKAPASVSVITAEDIELFGYRSLADALRDQRGFYLHTDGLNWFAGVRGFLRPGEWNSRITVTVDGRPTNEVIYGQSHLDQDFVLPMEAVKQIEVVRGPGSALYGGNAVFGVVNVVPKEGSDINGGELRLQGGTQGTGRASVLYGKALDNGWDLIGGMTGYTSQGDDEIIYDGVHDAAHNFGHIRSADYEGAQSAFARARNGDLTITADFANRAKDNRSATYLVSFENPGVMHEQRANLTLRYDHEIDPGERIHAMAYYGHYAYDQSYFFDQTGATPAYKYRTDARDDWVGEEIHYDRQLSKSLHLLVGADAKESLFTRQTDHSGLSGTVLDIPASYSAYGVFGEAELKLNDGLALTGGLRLDGVQRIGTNLSPRFAAVVTPTAQDTIKALYGRAFRAPNLYEELYAAPGANVPNPSLRPEVVDTYELVWERQFQSGWRTSLGGYVWKMADAMENFQFPSGALQTRNGGTLWAHGVEAEMNKHWDGIGNFRAFGTFTRAEHDGQTLTQSPEWIVGAALAIPLYKQKLILSIEPQVVGRMKSDLNQFTQPSYITNVVLTSRDIVSGWDLQVGAYNLFSASARLPRDGAFNQVQPTLNYPEMRYMLSLTHRF